MRKDDDTAAIIAYLTWIKTAIAHAYTNRMQSKAMHTQQPYDANRWHGHTLNSNTQISINFVFFLLSSSCISRAPKITRTHDYLLLFIFISNASSAMIYLICTKHTKRPSQCPNAHDKKKMRMKKCNCFWFRLRVQCLFGEYTNNSHPSSSQIV